MVRCLRDFTGLKWHHGMFHVCYNDRVSTLKLTREKFSCKIRKLMFQNNLLKTPPMAGSFLRLFSGHCSLFNPNYRQRGVYFNKSLEHDSQDHL